MTFLAYLLFIASLLLVPATILASLQLGRFVRYLGFLAVLLFAIGELIFFGTIEGLFNSHELVIFSILEMTTLPALFSSLIIAILAISKSVKDKTFMTRGLVILSLTIVSLASITILRAGLHSTWGDESIQP